MGATWFAGSSPAPAINHKGNSMTPEVESWFIAHDTWHIAVEIYNARVVYLRQQEVVGNYGKANAHLEYDVMSRAMRVALAADKILYDALKAKGEFDGTG